MKKSLPFLLAIAATAMLLPACKKDAQIISSQSSQAGQALAQGKSDYGVGAAYQVELSANVSGPQGGGLWIWIGLYPNWQGDYSGSDCGHGLGAVSDKGDVTWHYTGTNNQWITINGVMLNGLDGFPTTITVPSKYGHYSGTIGSFLTLPGFIPPSAGNSQLQVAP